LFYLPILYLHINTLYRPEEKATQTSEEAMRNSGHSKEETDRMMGLCQTDLVLSRIEPNWGQSVVTESIELYRGQAILGSTFDDYGSWELLVAIAPMAQARGNSLLCGICPSRPASRTFAHSQYTGFVVMSKTTHRDQIDLVWTTKSQDRNTHKSKICILQISHLLFSKKKSPPISKMASFRISSIALALTSSLVFANPTPEVSPINIISSSASSVEELTPAFESFRVFLGGADNGNDPNSNPEGHRQINWDAGVVPFDMPGDFFATVVTRGASFQTLDGSNSFRVSNPTDGVEDDKFDSIVGGLSDQFQQFSNNRLFSPLEDNKLVVKFNDPGNAAIPAAVTGLGVVFTGVNTPELTKMEFYDADECLLAAEYVLPSPEGGLSFLGVSFGDTPVVVSVHITLGGASLEESGGDESSDDEDVVVMDDFLYGEPQIVVLPSKPSCAIKSESKKASKKGGKTGKSSKRERRLLHDDAQQNMKKNLRRSMIV
jgi:hypothetical protein